MPQIITTESELVLRTAELARAAPSEWEGFLKAFGKMILFVKDECVMADPTMLQVAQGRARYAAELGELFGEAVKVADRIKNGRG